MKVEGYYEKEIDRKKEQRSEERKKERKKERIVRSRCWEEKKELEYKEDWMRFMAYQPL